MEGLKHTFSVNPFALPTVLHINWGIFSLDQDNIVGTIFRLHNNSISLNYSHNTKIPYLFLKDFEKN